MKKVCFFMLIACFLAVPAMASLKVGSVELPTSISTDGNDLVLNGAGIRKKFFINLYVGALYVQQKTKDAASIINADAPMSIRLHITSGKITREKMLDAINEGFTAATDGNTASIKTGIDQLNACFNDEIKDGDLIELSYAPQKGVTMTKNGSIRGTIAGLEFKKALFAIWLGDKPADSGLKKDMIN